MYLCRLQTTCLHKEITKTGLCNETYYLKSFISHQTFYLYLLVWTWQLYFNDIVKEISPYILILTHIYTLTCACVCQLGSILLSGRALNQGQGLLGQWRSRGFLGQWNSWHLETPVKPCHTLTNYCQWEETPEKFKSERRW